MEDILDSGIKQQTVRIYVLILVIIDQLYIVLQFNFLNYISIFLIRQGEVYACRMKECLMFPGGFVTSPARRRCCVQRLVLQQVTRLRGCCNGGVAWSKIIFHMQIGWQSSETVHSTSPPRPCAILCHIHTYTHTHNMHTYILLCLHTFFYACIHSSIPAYTLLCLHTLFYAYIHSYIHT